LEAYTVALGENVLVPIRERLQEWNGPARMVWGLKDPLFPVQWAEWLDRTLPGSRGIKRAPEGNLFFPEEMPDLIAQEARTLWSAGRKPIAYLRRTGISEREADQTFHLIRLRSRNVLVGRHLVGCPSRIPHDRRQPQPGETRFDSALRRDSVIGQIGVVAIG